MNDTKTNKAVGEAVQAAYIQFGGKGNAEPVILRGKVPPPRKRPRKTAKKSHA